jgi:hypothetical protein
MPRSCNKTIIASSDGVNVQGAPVITPTSVISYVDDRDPQQNSSVHRSLATDNVTMLVAPMWARSVIGVNLPVQKIFDHVSMNPVLIRHWLKDSSGIQSGLMFPRLPLDFESRILAVQILKHSVNGPIKSNQISDHHPRADGVLRRAPPTASTAPSIQADLHLFVFRRELLDHAELDRFDPTGWRPESYATWVDMFVRYAPVLEYEVNGRMPRGACVLFRRIMHTHYADCGLLFGDIWWKFGLGDMIRDSLYVVMRGMLTDLFFIYSIVTSPPALPAFFNAVTVDSVQRMCAACLSSKIGAAQMKRCPCHQVYYCSIACQKANWKVHQTVCSAAAAS